MIKWLLIVIILIILMSGFGYVSLSGNIVNRYSGSEDFGSIDLKVEKADEEIDTEEAEVRKPSSIIVANNENKNIDLCENISCKLSEKTCPDGFVVSCENSCSSGFCSSCQPNCVGHEIKIENNQPGSEAEDQIQNQTIEPPQTENQTQQQQPQEPQTQQPKIINIKYDADGDDRKKENWNTEWVEIEGQTNMFNWTLSDVANHVFVFPEFAINGLVKVRSGYGNNTATELYFGDGPVWNNDGDTAYLKDQNGNLVDQYSY